MRMLKNGTLATAAFGAVVLGASLVSNAPAQAASAGFTQADVVQIHEQRGRRGNWNNGGGDWQRRRHGHWNRGYGSYRRPYVYGYAPYRAPAYGYPAYGYGYGYGCGWGPCYGYAPAPGVTLQFGY